MSTFEQLADELLAAALTFLKAITDYTYPCQVDQRTLAN